MGDPDRVHMVTTVCEDSLADFGVLAVARHIVPSVENPPIDSVATNFQRDEKEDHEVHNGDHEKTIANCFYHTTLRSHLIEGQRLANESARGLQNLSLRCRPILEVITTHGLLQNSQHSCWPANYDHHLRNAASARLGAVLGETRYFLDFPVIDSGLIS